MRSKVKRVLIAAMLLLFFMLSLSSLMAANAVVNKTNSPSTNAPKPATTKTTVVKDWLVVPVFYATNRAFAGKDGSIDYSEEPNGNGLLFGIKNIVVPIPNRSPLDKNTQTKMLWQRFSGTATTKAEAVEPEAKPEFDSNKCVFKDKLLGREEIVPAIHAYMKDTGNHDIVIFVHGCCSTYDRSLERAATLASHMQAPVLLYDWVSPKGFRMYLANETRAEQTVDDFCRFLSKIEKVTDAGNIILIGHSMGARLVDQAMVRRSAQMTEKNSLPRYKELMMCNADVDARSFLNHTSEFITNAGKNYIFVSRADETLEFSSMAHGGFSRLGAPGALVSDLAKIPGTEVVDITDNASKHEIPYWIVGNLYKYGNLGPQTDFQLKLIAPGHLAVVKTGVSQVEVKDRLVGCSCY
jgi:esterase/lipase superfamily enzyme